MLVQIILALTKPRTDRSASVGCLCTAVQSRGRGVDITEGPCAILAEPSNSDQLNLLRGGLEEKNKKFTIVA
jgi:hypothetical protein